MHRNSARKLEERDYLEDLIVEGKIIFNIGLGGLNCNNSMKGLLAFATCHRSKSLGS